MKEQHLAAAPFGARQVLPLSKHRELFARVWPVCWKQKPTLTHGSNCQRAWFGPVNALVAISTVQGRNDGIGALPRSVTWRCYPTGKGVSKKKQIGRGVQDKAIYTAARKLRAFGASPLVAAVLHHAVCCVPCGEDREEDASTPLFD